MVKRYWTISIVGAGALLLASCGASRVSQCNRLAESVNQSQEFMRAFEADIQQFSDEAAQVKNLDDIKAAASQYTLAVDNVVSNLEETLVPDLQSAELRDETLTEFRNEYIGVVEGFSAALKQAGDAMDLVVSVEDQAQLPERIEQSQKQTIAAVSSIEELSNSEASLINEVNLYCGAAQAEEDAAQSEETPEQNSDAQSPESPGSEAQDADAQSPEAQDQEGSESTPGE